MDDKGYLVGENFNITGIIDWTFARVVPAYEAFGPSLVTASMSDMYDGIVRVSEDDKLLAEALRSNGSPLTRFADSSGKVRRLMFTISMSVKVSWEEARAMFKGIISETCGKTDHFDWDTWRKDPLVEWGDDEELAILLSEQEIAQ